MLFVAVMITTRCAPQMAPYLSAYTITHHYPADKQTLYIENIYRRPSQAPSALYSQRLQVDIQPDNDDGINRVGATVAKILPD